jgi:hypothetical protein
MFNQNHPTSQQQQQQYQSSILFPSKLGYARDKAI